MQPMHDEWRKRMSAICWPLAAFLSAAAMVAFFYTAVHASQTPEELPVLFPPLQCNAATRGAVGVMRYFGGEAKYLCMKVNGEYSWQRVP